MRPVLVLKHPQHAISSPLAIVLGILMRTSGSIKLWPTGAKGLADAAEVADIKATVAAMISFFIRSLLFKISRTSLFCIGDGEGANLFPQEITFFNYFLKARY